MIPNLQVGREKLASNSLSYDTFTCIIVLIFTLKVGEKKVRNDAIETTSLSN